MRADLMGGCELTGIIPGTQCVSFMPAVTMTTNFLIVALEGKRPETEHERKGEKITQNQKGKQERKRKKRESTTEKKKKKRERTAEKDT
jgi:hypothetical protein